VLITIFFFRTSLYEHEAHFFVKKFKNKLRTIPVSAEEQSFNYLLLMYFTKAASSAISKLHFASHL